MYVCLCMCKYTCIKFLYFKQVSTNCIGASPIPQTYIQSPLQLPDLVMLHMNLQLNHNTASFYEFYSPFFKVLTVSAFHDLRIMLVDRTERLAIVWKVFTFIVSKIKDMIIINLASLVTLEIYNSWGLKIWHCMVQSVPTLFIFIITIIKHICMQV